MTKMKIFNAAIIGAGKIGALSDSPNSSAVITHAHGFYKSKKFNLVGFVDKDRGRAKKAASLWKCEPYESLEELFSKQKIDVISNCTPNDCHFETLKHILNFPIKLAFTEKPLTTSLKQADKIIKFYRKKGVPLLVNYRRRFAPEFIDIKEKIEQGLFGKYLTGTGYYGKGLLHNGSHLIDLINFLLGEIAGFSVVDYNFDFKKDDPSTTAILFLKNKEKFFLQHIDHNLFTIFELDLIFEKKRIRITDSGFKIEIYSRKKDPLFKGYVNMEKEIQINTKLDKIFSYASENIYDHLTRGSRLLCEGKDAYEDMKLATKIINSIK